MLEGFSENLWSAVPTDLSRCTSFFFQILLSRRLFSPEFGLFCEVPDHSLVPNKKAYSIHRTLCQPLYRLAGNVVSQNDGNSVLPL